MVPSLRAHEDKHDSINTNDTIEYTNSHIQNNTTTATYNTSRSVIAAMRLKPERVQRYHCASCRGCGSRLSSNVLFKWENLKYEIFEVHRVNEKRVVDHRVDDWGVDRWGSSTATNSGPRQAGTFRRAAGGKEIEVQGGGFHPVVGEKRPRARKSKPPPGWKWWVAHAGIRGNCAVELPLGRGVSVLDCLVLAPVPWHCCHCPALCWKESRAGTKKAA